MAKFNINIKFYIKLLKMLKLKNQLNYKDDNMIDNEEEDVEELNNYKGIYYNEDTEPSFMNIMLTSLIKIYALN